MKQKNNIPAFLVFFFSMLFSLNAYSQSCNSLDNRTMVEQLDCYCNPTEKSFVEVELEKIGNLSKSFYVDYPKSCHSAVIMVLLLSKEKNIQNDVETKLNSLEYSNEQIQSILQNAKKQMNNPKHTESNSCRPSTGRISFSLISFGNKKKEIPAECEVVESAPATEEMNKIYAMTLLLQISKHKNANIFSRQLTQIESIDKMVENYPKTRINSCLKLTQNFSDIGQCLDSAANDDKIASCSLLSMSSSSAIKCLDTKADTSSTLACKALHFSESSSLSCLNLSISKELSSTCGILSLSEQNSLKCLKMNPAKDSGIICKNLYLSNEGTLKCLQINPELSTAQGCKFLYLSESGTLNCLQVKPTTEMAISCKELYLSESGALKCLNIKAPVQLAMACKSLGMSESSTLTCIQTNTTVEKINHCKTKYLPEAQNLECIRN